MADYITALKITPDGQSLVVALPTGDAQLDAIRDVIECVGIAPVNLGNDLTMWVGWGRPAPDVWVAALRDFVVDWPFVNLMATGIAARHGLLTHEQCTGDVLFTGGMDERGENLGLTAEQADELRAIARSVDRFIASRRYWMGHPPETTMQETTVVQTKFAPENGLLR